MESVHTVAACPAVQPLPGAPKYVPGYFELYGYDDGRYIGNPNLKPIEGTNVDAAVEWYFAEALTSGYQSVKDTLSN